MGSPSRIRTTLLTATLLLVTLAACASPRPAPGDVAATPTGDSWIVGATVIDGTGAPGRVASVRIRGDRIAEIGGTPPAGATVVDGAGLVLAPGFIDTHSHHDRGLLDMPDARGAVSQGITTIVVGNDGGSPYPVADFFARVGDAGVAVNVASYAGHGTIRRQVMGDDFRREATPAEVEAMRCLLRQELDAGALGLSTGLEYDPGIYSSTDEVIALAREAAAAGGRYITHMRSEDRAVFDAVEETIRIGRETGIPVQIGHMKLAMKSLWGRGHELIARLERARAQGVDVTADVYPYTYWQSTMTVLFPERDFTDREAAEFAIEELAPAEGMLIARYEPEPSYEGRTLADVARERGEDPVTAYMALTQRAVAEDADESIIATSMSDDDVATLIAWEHTNISSDGALAGAHPRGFGAFTRVLGPMVRSGVLSLEDAVRKMTTLSAAHTGIRERGQIRVGYPADLVLFDPATVTDRATAAEPHAASEGIRAVWVNGRVVYREGQTTDARPGRILRRETTRSEPRPTGEAEGIVRAILETEGRKALAFGAPLLVDSVWFEGVDVAAVARDMGLEVGHWTSAARCQRFPGKCERLRPFSRWVSIVRSAPGFSGASNGSRLESLARARRGARTVIVDIMGVTAAGGGWLESVAVVVAPAADGSWEVVGDQTLRIT